MSIQTRIKFKPRFTEHATIIELPNAINAEAGDYLALDNGSAEIIKRAECSRWLIGVKERAPSESPPAKQETGRRARTILRSTKTRTHGQTAVQRILLAFGPDAGGAYFKRLSTAKLAEIIGEQNRPLVSARLSELVRGGSLESHPSGTGNGYVYSLTSRGERAARELRNQSKAA
jgi:hypothetical protein